MTKRIRIRLAALPLLLCALALFASCGAANGTAAETDVAKAGADTSAEIAPAAETTEIDMSQYVVNDGLEFYDSIDEFVAAVRSKDAGKAKAIRGTNCYYAPKVLPENAEVKQVRVREIYVCITYSIPNNVFPDESESFTRQADFVWHRVGNPEVYLANLLYSSLVYTEITYNGRTYYYSPSYGIQKPDDPDKKIWVHSFYFLSEDGEVIQVNLPAIMSAEEAVAYADVERVPIR